jgi:predicted nucleic acid-binding protein
MMVSDRTVVVDASIGIARVRPELASPSVRRLLTSLAADGSRLLVPAHFWIEVINALGVRHRMSVPEIAEALHELDQLAVETVEVDRPLLLSATTLLAGHRLTAYDALYLALAEARDARLATLDRELAAAAGGRAIRLEDAGPPRRLAEQRAAYGAPVTTAAADPGRWPGFGAYLAELRARERPSRGAG